MDRFKFRGKRVDNGELVYGSLHRDECGWHIADFQDVCVDLECNSWELQLVLVGIVDGSQEQCTGLKDKNGKLIYESDILGTSNDDPEHDIWGLGEHGYTVVKWSDYISGWTGSEWFWEHETCSVYSMRYVEILGNIHEHKHLLEA